VWAFELNDISTHEKQFNKHGNTVYKSQSTHYSLALGRKMASATASNHIFTLSQNRKLYPNYFRYCGVTLEIPP
jgi:hypothetical protein